MPKRLQNLINEKIKMSWVDILADVVIGALVGSLGSGSADSHLKRNI
ncbi:MAG: hypothetical protein GX297_00990 [Treponema sp.]|jgi:hypothetical protein|nr:hypothetical protein [Treponema sp.]